MFNQANKDIVKHVNSGEYFKDSVDWYISKFLSPISNLAYAIVFTIFMLYGSYMIINLFFEDLKVKVYPFPIYSVDQVKYFPHIKSLSDVKEPINVSVARYLSSQYVEAREKYDFQTLNDEVGGIASRNAVYSMSSARVGYEYKIETDENNPDSPVVRYKSAITRNIIIDKVELGGRWDLPEKAVVYFIAKEVSSEGIDTSNWKAEMEFSMHDLEKKQEGDENTKLRFIITSYQTYKLS